MHFVERVADRPMSTAARAFDTGQPCFAVLASSANFAEEAALKAYYMLPTVRGDLLQKLGRLDEARAAFERAASLTRNERERAVLLARAAACAGSGAP